MFINPRLPLSKAIHILDHVQFMVGISFVHISITCAKCYELSNRYEHSLKWYIII